MQFKFKLGVLAWGIAAAMAFPAAAAASDNAGTLAVPSGNNNSAVCNLLATGNTNAANQCRQENTATNTQTTTTTGGNGGTATGGNAGPSQVVGNGSQAGSNGGDAYANGGSAESHSSLDSDQSNQISGRDSSLGSYVGEGDNNSDVCKQLASGDTQGNDQCHQSNTATNTQTTSTTGGSGGTATGGNGGPTQVVGDDSQAGSSGGDAYANGGDAESHSSLENEQSNQISGRDSLGSGYEESASIGGNNSAVCNQLATGNTMGNNQCRQDNTATNTQTTSTVGGNGGTATGGNSGPVQVVGNGSQAGSSGGDAYANGGDAESDSSLENEQSNQISGRDSSGSDYLWELIGGNNSAVCNQLATGNTFGNDQCHQSNTVINTQTTSTTGGDGGTATGGNSGPVQVVGDGSQTGSYGGDAYANGGNAESHSSLDSDQSNQISGRDSLGSHPQPKATVKKAKKSQKRARSKVARSIK